MENNEITNLDLGQTKKPRPVRVKTLTRKDVEDKMEMKLSGKRISKKLIVDSLFESLRELIMSADPINRIEIQSNLCCP